MFKKFIPFCTAKSIYELDINFLKLNNAKTLFIDIDNTLDSYKKELPSDEVINLINDLKKEFNVVLISNNKKKKVLKYTASLNVDVIYKAYKPTKRKINKYISEHNLLKNDIILIGDQLMTDIWCANNIKVRSIWCQKLVKEDQWTTHINRLFEKPISKYHKKHGNLKDWREIYGKM